MARAKVAVGWAAMAGPAAPAEAEATWEASVAAVREARVAGSHSSTPIPLIRLTDRGNRRFAPSCNRRGRRRSWADWAAGAAGLGAAALGAVVAAMARVAAVEASRTARDSVLAALAMEVDARTVRLEA